MAVSVLGEESGLASQAAQSGGANLLIYLSHVPGLTQSSGVRQPSLSPTQSDWRNDLVHRNIAPQ